jgi:prevent-host-death family protein
MRKAGVAQLKARLSAYLRRVQRGEEVVVMDRDTPVARLVPYAEPRPRPLPYRPALRKLHARPAATPGPRLEVDAALGEERRDRA